jgi:long-subunit fatty acid transport protein
MGASYHLNKHFRIDAVYEHIFMAAESIDATENVGSNAQQSVLETNTVQADYTGSADIVAFGLNYQF